MNTEQEKAAYVAAFMDGEGHIGHKRTSAGFWQSQISFCNTDRALVDVMVRLLGDLGLPTRESFQESKREGWASRWTVYLAGGWPTFQRFFEIVPIQSPRKREILAQIVAHRADVASARLTDRISASTPCESCGAAVYVSPAFRRRGGGRFCSVECRGAASRKRISVACSGCGDEFLCRPTHAKTRRYCGNQCFQRVNSAVLAGRAASAANARWRKSDAIEK